MQAAANITGHVQGASQLCEDSASRQLPPVDLAHIVTQHWVLLLQLSTLLPCQACRAMQNVLFQVHKCACMLLQQKWNLSTGLSAGLSACVTGSLDSHAPRPAAGACAQLGHRTDTGHSELGWSCKATAIAA